MGEGMCPTIREEREKRGERREEIREERIEKRVESGSHMLYYNVILILFDHFNYLSDELI